MASLCMFVWIQTMWRDGRVWKSWAFQFSFLNNLSSFLSNLHQTWFNLHLFALPSVSDAIQPALYQTTVRKPVNFQTNHMIFNIDTWGPLPCKETWLILCGFISRFTPPYVSACISVLFFYPYDLYQLHFYLLCFATAVTGATGSLGLLGTRRANAWRSSATTDGGNSFWDQEHRKVGNAKALKAAESM